LGNSFEKVAPTVSLLMMLKRNNFYDFLEIDLSAKKSQPSSLLVKVANTHFKEQRPSNFDRKSMRVIAKVFA
jgi:hypothetical protein